MKKVFASLFLTSLFFTACKKDQPSTVNKAIIGQWSWVSQHRGSPANTLTPQNTGIAETLVFNADNSWSVVQNGSTVISGTFRISFETTSRGEQVNSVSYRSQSSRTDSTSFYKVYNDTLVFSNDFTGAVGSGARYYVKHH